MFKHHRTLLTLGILSTILFSGIYITNSQIAAEPPTIGPCQVFPEDNPWNWDVSNYPVHPNSANYISSIGLSSHVHPDFGSGTWEGAPIGIPYVTVDNSQPMVPIDFVAYGDESDPGPYPIPDSAPVEGGNDSNGDRHVIAVNTDTCLTYELYRAFKIVGGWEADSGAIWDLNSNALRPDGWTSADAAGLPIFPGLVKYAEAASGEITHAFRFTAAQTQRAYIYPATHYASSNTNPNLPPMGLRVRLKASYNINGMTGEARVIAEALKKYGMILADNGSNWYISGEPNEGWNNSNLNQLKTIPGSAFEVVDTSINANFTSENNTSYLDVDGNHTVNFEDNSTGSPTEWEWDFGDGSSVEVTNDPTISHDYNDFGTYTVTMTASGPQGEDTVVKQKFVEITPWSQWESSGGQTLTPIKAVEYHGRLFQFIGGVNAPHKIWYRSTTDGVFNGSDSRENWTNPSIGGNTQTEVGVAVFNDALYISVRGSLTNEIFTARMTESGGIETWDTSYGVNGWSQAGGKSGSAIEMETFLGRLYQVIKGSSTNYIWVRYTTDGLFNDSAANEIWLKVKNANGTVDAQMTHAAALEVFGPNLYMSVRGASGNINTARTADGIWDGSESTENFVANGGLTSTSPSLAYFDDTLYQVIRGNSGAIYLRTSVDGLSWSSWVAYSGTTPTRPEVIIFGDKLFEFVKGNTGNIFSRYMQFTV